MLVSLMRAAPPPVAPPPPPPGSLNLGPSFPQMRAFLTEKLGVAPDTENLKIFVENAELVYFGHVPKPHTGLRKRYQALVLLCTEDA